MVGSDMLSIYCFSLVDEDAEQQAQIPSEERNTHPPMVHHLVIRQVHYD